MENPPLRRHSGQRRPSGCLVSGAAATGVLWLGHGTLGLRVVAEHVPRPRHSYAGPTGSSGSLDPKRTHDDSDDSDFKLAAAQAALSSAPVLRAFDPARRAALTTDASNIANSDGFGAELPGTRPRLGAAAPWCTCRHCLLGAGRLGRRAACPTWTCGRTTGR
jgi:hypothetical protein